MTVLSVAVWEAITLYQACFRPIVCVNSFNPHKDYPRFPDRATRDSPALLLSGVASHIDQHPRSSLLKVAAVVYGGTGTRPQAAWLQGLAPHRESASGTPPKVVVGHESLRNWFSLCPASQASRLNPPNSCFSLPQGFLMVLLSLNFTSAIRSRFGLLCVL